MPSIPGILTVTLHEAVGLSVADQHRERPTSDKHTCTRRIGGRPSTCQRCNYPYARLEYEKCQASLDCYWGTKENPVWIGRYGVCKFDVSHFSELAIHLYVRVLGPFAAYQDVLLGIARVDPFEEWEKSEARWLNVQDGTGKIRISFNYEDVGHSILDTASFEHMPGIGSGSLGYISQMRKKDTRQVYAQKRSKSAELICNPGVAHSRPSQINHPFIAPLAFAFQSQEDVYLLSPFVGGGHLFNHLQRERYFDVHRTQFYAAEILCALEYLHDIHGIHSWLKPRNDGDRSIHGTPEYPAPELLLSQDESRTADWWTLGIFIYEMLTGLPLFYDEDFDKIRPKILNQPIRLPESLPPVARDIIAKLLDRRPEKRLGADGGAPEIKSHHFFSGIDWDKVLQRNGSFKQHGVNDPPQPRQPLFPGFTYNGPVTTEPVTSERIHEDDGWELVWEEVPSEFHLYNRFTREKQPIFSQDTDSSKVGIHSSANPAVPTLQSGRGRVISQLLEYGMDLNIWIFNTKRTTPLEWAVEHENLSLAKLFLDEGADANFPNPAVRGMHQGGPALIKAVERGNEELVQLLAQDTNRVALTRALGLASGAQCDFEEGDRPLPQHPLDNGCYFRDLSEPEEFTPPLVRAVKRGHIGIVRVLLSHGADANAGYHGLEWEPIGFSCGRVVQLAMELGYQEIVQLLLAYGADVDLVQPVWAVPGHDCGFVPRPVYQRVIASVRAAVIARKGG
ncbi:protein kinase [Hypomontagnella submonticulosa]|nr:protein kinase [Hypomontagnella submonticulosa]